MDRCIAQMKRFDYDTRMKYYLPKFDNDSEIAYDPDVFTNALVDRAQFTKFAAMCVNYDLHKKYGLMAQSDIVYCIRSYDDYFAEYGMALENTFLAQLNPFAISYFPASRYLRLFIRCSLCQPLHYHRLVYTLRLVLEATKFTTHGQSRAL